MASSKTRVRFAPSPTGLLHVGNARTALYNWLFAQRTGGDFLLRIEDTDVERSKPRFETQLLTDLHWLGLDWSEGPESGQPSLEPGQPNDGPCGPYRQSERLEIYQHHTDQLLATGKAYRCFCTAEQLEVERQQAIAEQRPQVYSGRCRGITPEESATRAANGEAFAVRLHIPDAPLRFHDIVHGPVEFSADTVSDPILVRSNGMPVYNYVVTIDDALMGITHVIRGDDHLSNTPKQVAIYHAFGWPLPEFAHLSTILGPDRTRLSKRHGATSIGTFREMGILPEALTNYLALLGWGAEGGTRETFTLPELVREFTLERVTPSPAVFDFQKLHWLNRHYLKLADPERIATLVRPAYVAAGWMPQNSCAAAEQWFSQLLALFVPSVDQLDQLPEKTHFLFALDTQAIACEPSNAAILATDIAQTVLKDFAARIAALGSQHPSNDVASTPAVRAGLTPEAFKAVMNEVKAATGAKGKDLFHPVRIALTGAHSGPEFDKLIPLIESGSTLALPTHIASVQERAATFVAALR
ncbi:MAG TPA: glutamate--tRNA ligase [Acidobacteriaceae bacterium]|jgi:glutamyl-tRNA synthetase/nondiscriminating glutamyl-tRNA synthetase|nr:glutamate--tRNA ligase [Acidobacteriaceae bacterium]